MKARDGYSLVEVMVVMVILSSLAVIGTMNYREYSQRYQAESQTRMLFQEILKARSDALYLRRGARLKIYRARFEVFSSGSDLGEAPGPDRAPALPPALLGGAGR